MGRSFAEMSEVDRKIVSSVKSNGVYSLRKGWLKHPERETIPEVDMDGFWKAFGEWKGRYDGLVAKAHSALDKQGGGLIIGDADNRIGEARIWD